MMMVHDPTTSMQTIKWSFVRRMLGEPGKEYNEVVHIWSNYTYLPDPRPCLASDVIYLCEMQASCLDQPSPVDSLLD